MDRLLTRAGALATLVASWLAASITVAVGPSADIARGPSYRATTPSGQSGATSLRGDATQPPVDAEVLQAEFAEPCPVETYPADCGVADCGIPDCGLAECGVPDCGCLDECCEIECASCCAPGMRWYFGFEATFMKPYFEDNVAFTTTATNNTSFDTLTDSEFNYDLEFSPRAIVGVAFDDGIGFRSVWWQFDHEPDPATGSPPANGFGNITPPPFGDVDISSNIPTDRFTATSSLNAYTVDLEAVKEASFCAWRLGVAAGVRYALIEQSYEAVLRNSTDARRGQIDYRHTNEGVGPTISLASDLALGGGIDLFCQGRGSLLFGESESRLTAGEDLDLATPFTTTQNTDRDDLLPVADLQLGIRWLGGSEFTTFRPFLSMAMEGQYWAGVGNAVSEDGNLGFFGFNSTLGFAF